MMDNAAANIRSTAEVDAVWVCKRWIWKKGDYCGATNLMAREECYRCSYRISPEDWWEAAQKQKFVPKRDLPAQYKAVRRTQGLDGCQGDSRGSGTPCEEC